MKRLWRTVMDAVAGLADELASLLEPREEPAPVPVRVRRRDS